MTIKIGTRRSPLALWQAGAVKKRLADFGFNSELVEIESSGDVNLTQPIYSIGITGVFTKELDIALLENRIHLAVHSLKDVPTQPAEGLAVTAVLERAAHQDVLLLKKGRLPENEKELCIATSSIRRGAQWLMKYPGHKLLPIRGNIQTRYKKFENDPQMDGIIFAKAGLERMGMLPDTAIVLDWMIPAPAQGIIGIVCREDDQEITDILRKINHLPSFIAGSVERNFMNVLMGGCSVPVSAYAELRDEEIFLKGAIHATDGSICYRIDKSYPLSNWQAAGKYAAAELLQQPGASRLLDQIRRAKDQS